MQQRDPEATFCVLTADHIIRDVDAFQRTFKEALVMAGQRDSLITIGIPPTEPSTAFGYIQAGERLEESNGIVFHQSERFVEKPDQETAQGYIDSGNYFWNAGLFIWSVSALRNAMTKHHPVCLPLIDARGRWDNGKSLQQSWRSIIRDLPKISIDYAIMEQADHVIIIESPFAWDDVGSWTALRRHFEKDEHANVWCRRCRFAGCRK